MKPITNNLRKSVQEFIKKNPVNYGLNWQSGQEIAIRLINFSITFSLFSDVLHGDKDFNEQFTFYLKEHSLRLNPL